MSATAVTHFAAPVADSKPANVSKQLGMSLENQVSDLLASMTGPSCEPITQVELVGILSKCTSLASQIIAHREGRGGHFSEKMVANALHSIITVQTKAFARAAPVPVAAAPVLSPLSIQPPAAAAAPAQSDEEIRASNMERLRAMREKLAKHKAAAAAASPVSVNSPNPLSPVELPAAETPEPAIETPEPAAETPEPEPEPVAFVAAKGDPQSPMTEDTGSEQSDDDVEEEEVEEEVQSVHFDEDEQSYDAEVFEEEDELQ
jgi:hypothetical protein